MTPLVPLTDEGEARRAAAGPPFTVRDTLAWTWQTWSWNAVPLAASAILLSVPGEVYLFLPRAGHPLARAGLALLGFALLVLCSFASGAGIVRAGLWALHGEPVRIGAVAREGSRRAWLTAKVLSRMLWLPVLVALVLGVLARRAAAPLISPAWLLTGLSSLAAAVAMARCYPALPLALLRPDLGARAAVRTAAQLTRGARPRLLAVALVLQLPALPLVALLRWARALPEGPSRWAWLLAYALTSAVLGSFTSLAQVSVLRALSAGELGHAGELEALERVFD